MGSIPISRVWGHSIVVVSPIWDRMTRVQFLLAPIFVFWFFGFLVFWFGGVVVVGVSWGVSWVVGWVVGFQNTLNFKSMSHSCHIIVTCLSHACHILVTSKDATSMV